MNKNIIKKVLIFFVILAILFVNFSSFATTGSDLINRFDGETGDTSADSLIDSIITPILSAIRIVAVGIAIIMLTYLGIKYMSVAPSEKANIKSQLITFVIGALLVAGTTSVLEVLMKFAQKIGK